MGPADAPRRKRVHYASMAPNEREAHRAKKREQYAADARTRRAARAPEDRVSIHFAQSLRTRYGMTVADFDEKWERQGGKCSLCWLPLRRGERSGYAVDHDHSTGKPRDLLCLPCNTTLGFFEKNRDRLDVLADYVDRHRGVRDAA